MESPNKFLLYGDDALKLQSEYHTVTIVIPDGTSIDKTGESTTYSGIIINGVMQDNFSFGMSAEWKQVLKAGGFSETLEAIMLVEGTKVYNAGGITKQYYIGTDYISIPVKFRIYAGDPNNELTPLQVVSALSQLMLPTEDATIARFLGKVKATIEKGKKQLETLAGDLIGGKGTVAALDTFLKSLTVDVGNTVCTVKFGNWLTGQFVLTDVKFDYSKEISVDKGPYYVDIDATFKSLMIPTKASFKFDSDAALFSVRLLNKGKSRVIVK